MRTFSPDEHEEIQRLAYNFWEERGRPFDSSEEDWFRAERQIVEWQLALDDVTTLPFSSLHLGPATA